MKDLFSVMIMHLFVNDFKYVYSASSSLASETHAKLKKQFGDTDLM